MNYENIFTNENLIVLLCLAIGCLIVDIVFIIVNSKRLEKKDIKYYNLLANIESLLCINNEILKDIRLNNVNNADFNENSFLYLEFIKEYIEKLDKKI